MVGQRAGTGVQGQPWATLAGHPGLWAGGEEKWAGTDLKCAHSRERGLDCCSPFPGSNLLLNLGILNLLSFGTSLK